jgi:hypothetical protein
MELITQKNVLILMLSLDLSLFELLLPVLTGDVDKLYSAILGNGNANGSLKLSIESDQIRRNFTYIS